MIATIRRQLTSSDGRFLKSSAILTVGFIIARALGLGFSLLLGRALPAESYGSIQYSILLSGLLLIGTQPFVQHILAREISVTRNDPEKLNRMFNSSVALIPVIIVITLVIAVPLFILSGEINIGALVIFFGATLFYSYYGLARGFEASGHLVAVFIASNAIQLLLILVIYFVFKEQSTLPALAVYGLSYVVPVMFLSWRYPLPVHYEGLAIDGAIAGNLVKASVPLWISQATYAFGTGADVFLLQRFFPDSSIIGAYTFTRQLNLIFDFVPMALQTLLLPRAARADNRASRRRLMLISLAGVIATNIICAIIYLAAYEWFIRTFFDERYLLPAAAVLLMVTMQMIYGLYSVVGSMLVGINRSSIEMASRIIVVITMYAACWLLIPTQGATGAALSNLIAAIVSIGSVLLLFRMRGLFDRSQSSIPPSAETPIS
jgi:O-antigen/teichoic acid export membrane protein